MSLGKELEKEVSSWPNLTVQPHRFAAREFRFGAAEVGHVHMGGVVDIPFPRSIHDALLSEGLAEKHRWVPDSGWVTFHMRSEGDLQHAVWLMRLSYLRYVLKSAADPLELLAEESDRLQLSPLFRNLLAQFAPRQSENVA